MELPYAETLTSSEGRGNMVNTNVSARQCQLFEISNQSSATRERGTAPTWHGYGVHGQRRRKKRRRQKMEEEEEEEKGRKTKPDQADRRRLVLQPASSSFSSSKRRKLKRETLLSCPSKRLKLKNRGEDGFSECEEILKKSAGSEMKGEDAGVYHLPGIPLAPSNQNGKSGVIFVLENASLVLAYVGRRYQILNPDEHADFLRRKKMDPYKYRPDIVFDALTRIMDSRLCMSGRVQEIYIKTDEGILIKVEPRANIPKTLEKFCAMIAELLQKFSIKAKGRQQKLLHLVANPISQHLPVNSLKIGLSFSSQKAVRLEDYVSSVGDDVNLVFVVGAMAHGKIDNEHTDDFIAVSGYPLSAGECLRIICIALDKKWKIW